MKKYIITIICIFTLCTFFIAGCGHNVFTASKGIGVQVVFSGDNTAPTFRGGQWDAISYVPRGNTAMGWTTSTGGILGTGGTSQTITLTAGPQLNEGNWVEILNGQNCPQSAKMLMAGSLSDIIKQPVNAPQIAARTTYAAGGAGPGAGYVKAESTGVDKIVDKVAENSEQIKDVANTAVNAVGDVANTVVETAGDVSESTLLTLILSSKWALIIAIVCIVLIILSLVLLIIKVAPIIKEYFTSRKVSVKSIAGTVDVSQDKDNNTVITVNAKDDTKTQTSYNNDFLN